MPGRVVGYQLTVCLCMCHRVAAAGGADPPDVSRARPGHHLPTGRDVPRCPPGAHFRAGPAAVLQAHVQRPVGHAAQALLRPPRAPPRRISPFGPASLILRLK